MLTKNPSWKLWNICHCTYRTRKRFALFMITNMWKENVLSVLMAEFGRLDVGIWKNKSPNKGIRTRTF